MTLHTPAQAANLAIDFFNRNNIPVPDGWYMDHDLFHVIGEWDTSNFEECCVDTLQYRLEERDFSFNTVKSDWESNIKLGCPNIEFTEELYQQILKETELKLSLVKQITPKWYNDFVTEFDNLVK